MERKIVYRELKDLQLLENNPRKITEQSMARLIESIQNNMEFFEARPIILSDRTGSLVIIAGNQRYKAAKKIGLKKVPTILLSGLSEEKEKEIVIRDNVSNGEWDIEILKEEWSSEPLSDWGVDVFGEEDEENSDYVEAKEDNFKEEDIELAPPVCKPGQIYELGYHRLMCGDSTKTADVERLMNGKKADLFLSDPPYNVNVTGGTKEKLKIKNDNLSDNEFDALLKNAFTQAFNALKPGGVFYVWYASKTHTAFEKALTDVGFDVKQQLIWVKNSLVLGRQDYQWKHEPCLYGWKEGAAHYFIDSRTETTTIEDKGIDINKMSNGELRDLLKKILSEKISTTVIKEDRPTKNDIHPTMKPIGLMALQIKNSSRQGEIVLDLFGGSGSTMMACEQNSRVCYTMELDPRYCDAIISRYEAMTGKKATLIEG